MHLRLFIPVHRRHLCCCWTTFCISADFLYIVEELDRYRRRLEIMDNDAFDGFYNILDIQDGDACHLNLPGMCRMLIRNYRIGHCLVLALVLLLNVIQRYHA